MKVKLKDGSSVNTEDKGYTYNKLIKKRLCIWRKNFEESMGGSPLNYSAIADHMFNRFGINTTAVKISKMFDPEDDRMVQVPELFALAQLFDIPIWDICEHPSTVSANMDYESLVKRKDKPFLGVRNVDNDFYNGEYWCYYFKTKHYEGQMKPVDELQLRESKLSIKIENSRTTVILDEMGREPGFEGNLRTSFTLSGNLYLFENTDIAYSFLTDSTGRHAMALMFTYLNISSDVRYYITAAMMTFTANHHRDPLFQKMAIFRKRMDHKNEDTANFIRGILSLNSCPIVIDEESISKMIEDNPVWKSVLTNEKAMTRCLVFSESSVRDSLFKLRDEKKKVEMLLELRRNSLLPAHETIIESDFFSEFIKDYQLKHAKGQEE